MNLDGPKRTERLFSASAKWARRSLDVEMGTILDVSSSMMIEEFENDDNVEGEGEGAGEPFSRETGSPVSAVPPGGTSVYVRYLTVDMNGALMTRVEWDVSLLKRNSLHDPRLLAVQVIFECWILLFHEFKHHSRAVGQLQRPIKYISKEDIIPCNGLTQKSTCVMIVP